MTAMLSPEMPEGIRATLSYRGREVSAEIPHATMVEFLNRELAAGRDWSAVRAVLRQLETDEDWLCHICGTTLRYEETGPGTSYAVCPASERHLA